MREPETVTPRSDAEIAAASTLADQAGDAAELGARLRVLREEAGLSLRELARRLDISASAVSQIERGVMRPSVNRLIAIVGELGASITDVFAGGTGAHAERSSFGSYSLLRQGEIAPVVLENGVIYRRLSGSRTSGIDHFESTFPPMTSASAGDASSFATHTGVESGVVISGELTVEVHGDTVTLRAGDSITYSSETPHRVSNRSPEPCVANWVIARAPHSDPSDPLFSESHTARS
ncbi:XRE family transcriptional regulator [Pseudoclavibacter sp. VKM Ac-2867]|uniref:helix-turn-helix domain-containing protein n=1 Tax=Pseudoclavibacter sp. VKM Ac-2867 TaxID=2783829 RepID=UPI002B2765F2|nr:XRE family transcriptional regulator [Pseudoclavibacter sp. VKM Ac-2867]